MKLRFNTLLAILLSPLKIVKKALVFLMMLISCPVFTQNLPVEEIKKEANKLFDEEEYAKAYKPYSQLVANYPKDPEYNFKLGVCMIYAEPDKKKCLPYLQFAAKNKTDNIKDVHFYLGKACHINYLFDEAIKNYSEFKKTASGARQKKLQVDREIAACDFGKKLLTNLTDLVVLSKKQLSEADYFRSYDLKDIGGKLLAKPDEFKSAADKKKKDKSIVFLPKTGDRVYYSSYGENADNGRDIYYSTRLPGGTYSKPEKVNGINTEFDEDYPFLHPNGQTLYFASKGHNSMGGYDIFKSNYIEASNAWSTPVNLEFPINSPDDDYLFVTDSLEKLAYFSTGRQSPPGKTDVLKINTERKPIDILAIRGSVEKENADQSVKSKISIKNADTKDDIGIYYAEDNGEYTLELPNGAKLLFTVETPGLNTQSQEVALPFSTVSKPYKQTISYAAGILKITNNFDESPAENNYLQYLKVIEKKAKLEVNEGQNTLVAPDATAAAKKQKDQTGPQVIEDASANTGSVAAKDPKQGLDNKQLADIAKQDARESAEEATRLKQDSNDAFEVGNQQKEEAGKKLIAADEALKNAEGISNEDEKKQALEKAAVLKQEAENADAVANKILAFAKSLDADAIAKQKEADLNGQYATELEKAISSKNGNAQSMAKLDELQQQINTLSAQKNESDDLFNSIKSEIGEKEKQIAALEKTNGSVKANLDEIKTEITASEEELARTKKKKDKEAIIVKTNELKTEQGDKENQIAANNAEIKKLSDELAGLKNEMDLANRIKTETIAASTAPSASVTTSTPTPAAVKEQTVSIAKTTPKENKAPEVKNTAPDNTPDYSPLTAATGAEAIARLDELTSRLNNNDNELFDFNAYQNNQAQNLKVEADAGINDASAQVKKLREAIVASKEELAKEPAASGSSTPQQLNKEGDELATKAQGLRTDADTKTGDEKDGLITEAKNLEAKADEKYIQASEVTGSDNTAIFDTNQDNIKGLLAANTSEQADAAEAKRLSDEADIAFKQSKAIREEAKSLPNAGAKLGNLSNAEEIESGAIARQQQALSLLKKSNPGFALKSAITSSTPGAPQVSQADLDAKLKAVNDGINELANTKLNSYQKLYDANNSEIEAVMASLAKNQAAIDNTPRFKSEYVAGTGKLETAKGFKQSADEAANISSKLASLNSAIKKQLEALKQLNELNAEINKAQPTVDVAAAGNTITETPAAANPEPTVAATTQPAVENKTANTVIDTVKTTAEVPVAATTIDMATLAQKDSTAGQLAGYFDNAKVSLKNPQANSSLQKSLSELKSTDSEINSLESRINNYQPPATTAPISPIELFKKADELLVESEQISSKAGTLRAEASNKSGEEQDSLLTQAKELDRQAQDKKIEASSLYQQANASDYATNNNAINELLGKAKNDNPDLASESDTKNNELITLYEQTKKLRQEAEALDNPAAKLGAISNVEEKEAELIQKQNQLINELKKQYPDYVVKPLNSENNETREELVQKKTILKEKQHAQLTALTNAFSLEYEASKNAVPANLSPEQKAIRKNAGELNTESKRLLISAAQQKDEAEKTKLLTLSVKAGNAAVEQLNKIIPEKGTLAKTNPNSNNGDAALDKIGKDLANNTKTPATKPTKKTPAVAAVKTPKATTPKTKGIVKVEGLEVTKGNAYNDANPIPIDGAMENGLTFRVQIGAFKTRLPNNAFKGLSPLNGETTPTGYIRYTAGNFNKLENANAVKNDLRRLGYSDAFVVVYYNGKRITLGEALAIMDKEGKTIDPNAPQTAGITASDNVPKAAVVAPVAAASQETVVVTKELEEINGLLYTVQIGVYTRQVTKRQLLNLKPIFTEKLNNGLFRYTAGIYSNADRLIGDKRKVVELGVKDAFVSAYLNGKRIPFTEGKQKQAEDSTVRMEAENPIVFPEAGVVETPAVQAPAILPAAGSAAVQPFKNNVNSYPAATEENGVKTNEEGLSFKVQIGAYTKQVPNDVAARFMSITSWPVENKQINGLFIYNIGNFSEARYAKTLKEEALKLGISDAFITVYKNGVKLYGSEAAEALAK